MIPFNVDLASHVLLEPLLEMILEMEAASISELATIGIRLPMARELPQNP